MSSSAAVPAVSIRVMREPDIPAAMEIKNIAGWNQTERDWQAYLEYAPEGCFVAEREGRRVGTATAIRYADRFGWIGMVLVHPDARRLGLGTRLLHTAIDYVQRGGVRCVKLDATPMGRPVYVPMGFRDEYELSRYQGDVPGEVPFTSAAVQFMTERDLPEMAALDELAFGAGRLPVLRAMSRRNPEFCFVRRVAGKVTGFIVARYGQNAVQLGPWIATDADSAAELLNALWRRVPGKRVFVDVPHPNVAAVALIQASGFTVQRGYMRMFLGDNAFPGRPEWVFGTSSPEKG